MEHKSMEDGVGRSLWVGKRTPTLKWQNCSSSNGHLRLDPKASHLQLLNEQHTQKTIYGLCSQCYSLQPMR